MKKYLFTAMAVASLSIMSCEKEDDAPQKPKNNLPGSYNFENVDHSGQDARLDMLSEIVAYAKSSNDGDAIDANTLFEMYTNTNYVWDKSSLNSTTKQISDKLDGDGGYTIGLWINKLDSISQNPGTGSNGVAGLVHSESGTRQYLFDENGFEIAQLLEKGTMGALSYYQATSVYLSTSKMEVDNATVEAGKGTSMQHHWDEAFGYWGVPNDFGMEGFVYDKTADYHRFWAKYTNEVNEALGVNEKLMTAFIKGRDAINRKDYAARDAAISEVRSTWEQVAAAMAIHYINGAKADFSDNALRNHQLSEATGFIWSLQFNPEQKISDQEIDLILANQFANLYDITIQDLNDVKDQLANAYGLNDVKETL